MTIISQETFDKFTEEEKNSLFLTYKNLTNKHYKGIYTDEEINGAWSLMNTLFGKENLQPEPKIRTWEDVEKEHPEHFRHSNVPTPMLIPSQELRDKLLNKSIATYKIATLIELGYGGMVTEEEWKNKENPKSVIRCTTDIEPCLYIDTVYDDFQFIAFRTDEQAEKFMSYPENVKLIEQYYMI